MDYKTVPPPGWDESTPETWERAAQEARAMGRTALHYMPDLVQMFTAWADAWEARASTYKEATEGVRTSAVVAVGSSVSGDRVNAERYFSLAKRWEEARRAVLSVSYRSYLETIPNPE